MTQYVDAGAAVVTIHAEATDRPRELPKRVRAPGAGAGLAISPPAPVAAADAWRGGWARVRAVGAGKKWGGRRGGVRRVMGD